MLSFFFNRNSKMAAAMEVAGLVLLPFALCRLIVKGTTAGIVLFSLAVAVYIFIRFSAVKRWYPDAPRREGIGLHFKKALVPAGYICAVFHLLIAVFPSAWLAGIEALLMAAIAHVNVILLYFHFKDSEETPVNYFSARHS